MAVTVYDILDRPTRTATMDFEVLQATHPEIISYSPLSFMMNSGTPFEIAVEGLNFTGDSLFFLSRDTGGNQNTPRRIPAENVQVSPDGRRVTFTVPLSALTVANYLIGVENPGGIVATSEAISVGMIAERSASFSLGYTPIIPLSGYLFDDFEGFHPIGVTFRANYLFAPLGSMWLGLELAPGFARLGASTPGLEDATIFHIGLNTVGQFTLVPRRFFANARLGVALLIVDGYSAPQTLWGAGLTLGGSATWMFTKHLFAEAGLELSVLTDTPTPVYLRPALSLGYRYSRVVPVVPLRGGL
jgi:hypothetical protein